MKYVYIFIFFVPIISSAYDTCSTVRLDKGDGCVEGVPVSDQGSRPICYTHSSSLIMTGYLRQNQLSSNNVIVSPEKIWSHIFSSSVENRKKYLDANKGRTCQAIEVLKEIGACDKNQILKESGIFKSAALDNGVSHSYNESEIYDLEDTLLKVIKQLNQGNNNIQKVCDTFKNLNLSAKLNSELDPIFFLALQKQPRKLFDIILEKACKPSILVVSTDSTTKQIESPKCNNFDFKKLSDSSQELQKPEKFKEKIHQLLDRPLNASLPLGIEYCSGILTNPNKDFIHNRTFGNDINYLNSKKANKNFKDGCGFHASALIGREKRKDGKCYFLVQNSWGSSCHFYHNPELCEDGKIWVDEDVLSRNLLRVSDVQKEFTK